MSNVFKNQQKGAQWSKWILADKSADSRKRNWEARWRELNAIF